MKLANRIIIISLLILSILSALYTIGCVGCWIGLHMYDGRFHRKISENERNLRLNVVSCAKDWLDASEGSDRHMQLLQIYNSHEPRARGYEVTPSDNWCATYSSAVAIGLNITDIIPTECGCERQIDLWKSMERWSENDSYMPLPGDYIYYNWNEIPGLKDNTGWADHVGIVVGTAGPIIKVIEGNKDDCVCFRILSRYDYRIRGYGLPDYLSKAQ